MLTWPVDVACAGGAAGGARCVHALGVRAHLQRGRLQGRLVLPLVISVTLHPRPYTLGPTPYTLHPTP